jgi:hypothetical protein
MQFRLNCPQCGHVGDAIATDVYYKNASGINVDPLEPRDVEINYNDATADYTHFYTIPPTVRNDVVIGKKDIVEAFRRSSSRPSVEQKGIVFSKDNLFHMKPGNARRARSRLGHPAAPARLKDTFYLQIMKKAQEAILLEHIVPSARPLPPSGIGD